MSADLQILAHRITAVGVLLGQARTLIEDGKSADAKNLIKAGQAQLAEIARAQRQEHDRLSHLPKVRGDEALIADLQAVREDCLRDHRHRDHTPTDGMPRMKPVAYLSAAGLRAKLEADAANRSGRWSRFVSANGRLTATAWAIVGASQVAMLVAFLFGFGVL